MLHTVGIAGITGNVGAPTTKSLIQAAGEGKINLIIFHRASTDLTGLSTATNKRSENVEFRVLEFADPPAKIAEVVRGVNIFISAVGFPALPSEPNLVDGLALSPDLVTYIPSVYSTTWTERDFGDPRLGAVLAFLHGGWERAREKGVGVTAVYTGVFELFWFQLGFVGAPIKENIIWANEKQMQNRVPITAIEHLAQALTRIACADPQSIKNKEYSVVPFWPTGNELKELYTKINGQQAQVKEFTPADREAQMADAADFGPAKAGYWEKWESGVWGYEAEGRISDREYGGPGLEEIARSFA
ncbi:hypothetical protein B0A55_09295 [Friedmanniomyces simplex]|uniref:NmrA-like domain-containing protein n=1 Tax=Friedmanniomyces simplex TaxID=329884 RepID=A0A4U0WP25_9PEZI|nr:hypothetical protein B0A55_09295 [Friedmanniomyces simplex]